MCRGRLLAAFDMTYLLQTLSQHVDEHNSAFVVGGAWKLGSEENAKPKLSESLDTGSIQKASDMPFGFFSSQLRQLFYVFLCVYNFAFNLLQRSQFLLVKCEVVYPLLGPFCYPSVPLASCGTACPHWRRGQSFHRERLRQIHDGGSRRSSRTGVRRGYAAPNATKVHDGDTDQGRSRGSQSNEVPVLW